MMKNPDKSETTFLRFLEDQLNKRLPPGWSFRRLAEQPAGSRRVDATFELRSPDGRYGIVAIEFKRSLEPRSVSAIGSQLGQFAPRSPDDRRNDFETVLIGTAYLSPRTRELIAATGLSYADSTGNLRLVMRQPAVYIEATGAQKSPWRESKPLKSLKGRAVARVVRALCDFRPPYSTGDLAQKSGASLPTTSRVVNFLESEALLTKEGRGVVVDVSWDALIRRWTQDYSVLKTNTVSSFLEPRGLPALTKKLSTTKLKYAITGSIAAQIPTSVAPARLAMIYVLDPAEFAISLDLRPAENGANVLALEPFDSVVFDRAAQSANLTCAAFSQVAADLLTSPGRGPEEGEELLRWMKANEGEWRT